MDKNSSNTSPILTVVICTYNRKPLLERCLKSVAAQDTAASRFEILVVENNCTDGTPEFVSAFCAPLSNFRLVSEPAQGLSRARNSGWKEAKGQFVAFLDDDAEVPSNWVSIILNAIAEFPEAVGFGGPYQPYYLDPPPSWFRDSFASWDPGGEVRDFGKDCFCGANMVIKRQVLSDLGGFSPEFGVVGLKRFFAEESHLHLKMKKQDMKTLFIPGMKIKHAVKPALYSAKFLLRDAFQAGINAGEVGVVGKSKTASVVKIFATIALSPYYSMFRSDSSVKARVLYTGIPLARRIGYLIGLMKR